MSAKHMGLTLYTVYTLISLYKPDHALTAATADFVFWANVTIQSHVLTAPICYIAMYKPSPCMNLIAEDI